MRTVWRARCVSQSSHAHRLQLLNMAFARIGFGDLCTMMSDIYHSLRNILKLFPPRPDPAAFQTQTYKYFVRLEDVTKLFPRLGDQAFQRGSVHTLVVDDFELKLSRSA